MPLFYLILAAAIVVMVAIVVYGRRVLSWAHTKGIAIPQSMPAALALLFGLMVNARAFAQSTLDLDIDLSTFWEGFNNFFNALFPPLAFIASISAALGFIFLIISALKNAFSGSRA